MLRILGKALVATSVLVVCATAAICQDGSLSIHYRLTMSHPGAHLFEISMEVQKPSTYVLDSLDFQMPKWSPGRYAVFDFAKNVQEVKTHVACPAGLDCSLAGPPLTRADDQTWRVDLSSFRYPFGPTSIFLDYKVFANDLSGTFSQLDSRHANFNGGCIFMYVVNHKQDPVTLTIVPPKDWRVINGRIDQEDQREWKFPNWDIMTDTPTEIAPDWTEDNFKVDGKTYHVVVHSLGNEGGKRPDRKSTRLNSS